jgi:hypothetical protein
VAVEVTVLESVTDSVAEAVSLAPAFSTAALPEADSVALAVP